MTNEEQVNKICAERHMTKLSISKNPTWIDQNRMEGIDLELGKVRSFWNKDGERKYDEPASERLQKIISLINGCESHEESTKTESKTDESKPDKTENEAVVKNNVPELPDVLTPALMSKWAKMTTTDRILMFQKTPSDKIKQVVVGKDRFGKDIFASYVEGNYMFREANASFLFDWYLSDVVISVCPSGVGVTAKLNVWFSEYGKYLSRPATGYQELNKKVDVELAKKGATTDAIKKGLSLFGFNSDVYSGEV